MRSSDYTFLYIVCASLLSMYPGLMCKGVGWSSIHPVPLCWHSSQNPLCSLFWEICKLHITKNKKKVPWHSYLFIHHFWATLYTKLYSTHGDTAVSRTEKVSPSSWVGKLENKCANMNILFYSYKCYGESRAKKYVRDWQWGWGLWIGGGDLMVWEVVVLVRYSPVSLPKIIKCTCFIRFF